MKRILALASVALALSSQSFAADLYQPEPQAPAAEPVVVASNGWYLRGDISYDAVNLRGAKYFQGSNGLVNDFDSFDVDNTGNLGVGVGYKANDYLRFDTTFDYMFSSDFRGSTSGTCGVGGACKSRDVAAFAAYSLMANAYVDITTVGMFTPYIGVGIGGTRIKWDDLKNTACNGAGCDDTVTHKGKESWRFTYAAMLGTAIEINCKVAADVGYRYRHVEGGPMFGYKLNGGPGRDEGFDIHEARAGIRYNFGDTGCQQAYLPPVDMPQQETPVFK